MERYVYSLIWILVLLVILSLVLVLVWCRSREKTVEETILLTEVEQEDTETVPSLPPPPYTPFPSYPPPYTPRTNQGICH